MLNPLGEEIPQVPVTLPTLKVADFDIEAEAKEAAARIAERRVIRAGLDAWAAIGKAESFEAWRAIGAALTIGKVHALRVTNAPQAWGRNYSREFSEWIKTHGLDRMPKSVRSVAIELHENGKAIDEWRSTLSDKDRRRLIHPLSNVRRWRAATRCNGNPLSNVRHAAAAWRPAVNKQQAFEEILRDYLEKMGGVFREDIGLMDLSKSRPISLAILAKQLANSPHIA